MLVLDRESMQLVTALDNAFPENRVPRRVMDPRSNEFANAPLTTDRYSAILVASDQSCGGCDLNEFDSAPDSRAINARKGDIADVLQRRGRHLRELRRHARRRNSGSGNPADVYYDFLPLPAGGEPVTGPFCLTPIGARLGFEDQFCPSADRHRGTSNDINCCPTHNSFKRPGPDSALEIAEIDVAADGRISNDDVPETLIAEGVSTGGQIVSGPVLGKTVSASVVSGKVFIKVPAERLLGAREPEGGELRAAHREADDPGALDPRHAQGHGGAPVGAHQEGEDAGRPVHGRRLPGAPVAQAQGEGPDRAAAQGLDGRASSAAAARAATPRPRSRAARSAASAPARRAATAPAAATRRRPSAARSGT